MTTTTADREERIQNAHSRIDAAVQDLCTASDWAKWLKKASTFHDYSFNNTLLIASQYPAATQVAGAGKWRSLKRWPKKGEKAIWIFAPQTVNWSKEEIAQAPDLASTKKFIGFKAVPVFDVLQTDGQPIPEQPEAILLEGDAPGGGLEKIFSIAAGNGFTPRVMDLPAGVRGRTDFVGMVVTPWLPLPRARGEAAPRPSGEPPSFARPFLRVTLAQSEAFWPIPDLLAEYADGEFWMVRR
jgi:hypothetical protein